MISVRIKCAAYNSGKGIIRFGHVAHIEDEEAKSLIESGLATEYSPEDAVATGMAARGDDENHEAGENQPEQGCAENSKLETCEPSALALSEDELMKMTRSQLDELAFGLGIDSSKCKTKADVVALIIKATAEGEPNLNMEAPME